MEKQKEVLKIREKIKKIEIREQEIRPTQMWTRAMRPSPYDMRGRTPTAMSSFASRQRAKQETQFLERKKSFLKKELKKKLKKLLG